MVWRLGGLVARGGFHVCDQLIRDSKSLRPSSGGGASCFEGNERTTRKLQRFSPNECGNQTNGECVEPVRNPSGAIPAFDVPKSEGPIEICSDVECIIVGLLGEETVSRATISPHKNQGDGPQ